MAPANIWAPLEDGVYSSVWNPGGYIQEGGGGGGETCNLGPRPDLNLPGAAILDNFNGTDGTELNVHPANAGSPWESLTGDNLEILGSAAVSSVEGVEVANAIMQYVTAQLEIPFIAHVAAYEMGAFSGNIVFKVNSGEAELGSILWAFTRSVLDGTVTGNINWNFAGAGSGSSDPITLPFCTWAALESNIDFNVFPPQLHNTFMGVTEDIVLTGLTWDQTDVATMSITIGITNDMANTFRVADIGAVADTGGGG